MTTASLTSEWDDRRGSARSQGQEAGTADADADAPVHDEGRNVEVDDGTSSLAGVVLGREAAVDFGGLSTILAVRRLHEARKEREEY